MGRTSSYTVRAYWRGVRDQQYDVFHRRTKREVEQVGCVGEPERVWSVMRDGLAIADCFDREEATLIARALRTVLK